MNAPLRPRTAGSPRLAATLLGTSCLALTALAVSAFSQPPAGPRAEPDSESPTKAARDDREDLAKEDLAKEDLAKKAEIMGSTRWRRAIFELGEWLSSQVIYTPAQVRNIKADFNRRVERMTSQELEYLLDDLDAKFKILETPEARDARSWVGQYLSVMSDRKRAELLKDVPNVVTMSAGQLQQEIQKIEQKRGSLQQQQAAFDQGRQQLVEQAQAARQQTAAAAASSRPSAGVPYSPYRGGGGGNGKPPFSDVGGSGMTIYSGVFGAGVSMSVGNF